MNSDLYLDKAGLARFWRAIKSYVDTHSGGGVSLSSVYPVGSIYMSVNSTSPATLFGGTWERIQDRFLLAAGTKYAAGKADGEATHQLTAEELPDHRHTFTTNSAGAHTHQLGRNKDSLASGSKYDKPNNASSTSDHGYTSTSDGAHRHTGTTDGAGGTQPHNNMPPYLTVYMWKRIS